MATLTQLDSLDGITVTKSERILATQKLTKVTDKVQRQAFDYAQKEMRRKGGGWSGGWAGDKKPETGPKKPQQKIIELSSSEDDEDESGDEHSPRKLSRKKVEAHGFCVTCGKPMAICGTGCVVAEDVVSDYDEEAERNYWQEESEYTPEARVEQAARSRKQAAWHAEQKGVNKPLPKKPPRRRFFRTDGRPLNINDAGLNFILNGQQDPTEPFVLELECYKYLDTSQIDLDVQPTYVRATVKGKVFQLLLPEEVSPDTGKAERSKVTGWLMVTMPKSGQVSKMVVVHPFQLFARP